MRRTRPTINFEFLAQEGMVAPGDLELFGTLDELFELPMARPTTFVPARFVLGRPFKGGKGLHGRCKVTKSGGHLQGLGPYISALRVLYSAPIGAPQNQIR